MNDTLKTIATRFSCRSFTDQRLSDEQLHLLAQAAIQAPSGMNGQPWQIIVVKDTKLIADMDTEGMRVLAAMEDKSAYERMMSRGGKLFYNAPCMIVVAIKNNAQLDCGIAAQNVVLAATSMGINNLHCGLLGLAFAGDKAGDFKRRLQFPDSYECGIGILLGYAAGSSTPHTPDQSKITIIE